MITNINLIAQMTIDALPIKEELQRIMATIEEAAQQGYVRISYCVESFCDIGDDGERVRRVNHLAAALVSILNTYGYECKLEIAGCFSISWKNMIGEVFHRMHAEDQYGRIV